VVYEKAHAKINLVLDVFGKRDDGYHDLKMIMMPLELHDQLTFEIDSDIVLKSEISIPENAILKAAHILKSKYGVTKGAKITLVKNIPIGAGLAGGSADIAATLRGLNTLWELNLTLKELEPIALGLGSDTLFCLYNQTAYVSGRGEHILFLPAPDIKEIYLYPYDQEILTKKVFEHHKTHTKKNKFDRLLKCYLNNKQQVFMKNAYNDLEKTTLKCYPDVIKHKEKVRRIDKNAMMTGSGATYFSVIFDENDKKITEKIEKSLLKHIKTKPKI
jgi:4-diphosphocytidyl-2-C-methyl-D-erythritol kinase